MPRAKKTPELFEQNLLKSSVDGIFAFDTDLRYTAWNPAMEGFTGLRHAAVIDKHILAVFPHFEKTGEATHYRQALAGTSSILTDWPFAVPTKKKQGFSETYFSPLKDDTGAIIGGLGIIRDISEYKLAKEAGLKAEQQFRTLVHTSTDIICVISPAGHFLLLNPAWEKITGWSTAESLGMHFLDFVHPEDQSLATQSFASFKEGKFLDPVRARLKCKDGQYRILEATASPLIEDGVITSLLAVVRDVTSREQNEKKLRTWARIFESIDIGIKISNLDGTVVEAVNPGYIRMHGYTSTEELLNLPAIRHYSPAVQQELKKHNAILKKQGYSAYESEHVKKDGTVFPVSVEVTLIKDDAGKPQYRAVIVRDITARRILESQLHDYTKSLESKVAERTRALVDRLSKEAREKAKDEALLSSIGEGVIATDAEMKIVFINKQTELLLGWREGEMLGKKVFDVLQVHDKNHKPIRSERRPIAMAMATGKKIATSDYSYVRKNGTELPVVLTTSAVVLDNTIFGAVTVFRDITKEKEVDRVKSEFVSLASHQLRTPLATINWYAETLLSGKVPSVSERQKKYLHQIYDASRRMVKLVHDLLNVSRLELGTFKLDPGPLRLPELIQEVIEEAKLSAKSQKITLAVHFKEKLPTLMIDRQLIQIVFQNLLMNAIKYTPSGGSVTIEASYYPEGYETKHTPHDLPEGPVVICAITDTGYGIPREAREKVFTKFFRADNVKDRGQDGTGLGLYIVKSLIALLKGSVWFVSPGHPLFRARQRQGTTFYVAIPVPKRRGLWGWNIKKIIKDTEED